MTADLIDARRCLSCEHLTDEAAGPLYECGRCGNRFNEEEAGSNRCPDCNIFAGKVSDESCPECNEGEVEGVQAVEVDGELVAVGEGDDPEAMVAAALALHKTEQEEAAARRVKPPTQIVKGRELRDGDSLLAPILSSGGGKPPEVTEWRRTPVRNPRTETAFGSEQVSWAPWGGAMLYSVGVDEDVEIERRA